jgi:uncharacterized protein YabN with tetrapyrrole methylase and pyrophosphatase domain
VSATQPAPAVVGSDQAATALGTLVIAGSGIKSVAHMTIETRARIEWADKVLFCVADAVTEAFIRELSPSAEDLHVYYGDGKHRRRTYAEMTDRTMHFVRQGLKVCMVLYGHPGVFVAPSHASAELARAEGHTVEFLPAVSAEDCMWADLGIDPSSNGCQTYEATNFLLRRRTIDVHTPLVLWQIGCVGDPGFDSQGYDSHNLPVLVERLVELYGPDHEVVVYEAATHPLAERRVTVHRISDLVPADVTGISTMFVPPSAPAPFDQDMARRLGLA